MQNFEVPKPTEINNPDYKGVWVPRKIENPDYKGEWIHPIVKNPYYNYDENAGQINVFSSIGIVEF